MGRRVVIPGPGGYEQLQFYAWAPPAPRAREVRVAVRAVGVNYADCVIRMGLYASAKRYVGWPITPGFEVAGVVEAIGEEVDDVSVGDRVIAVSLFGGYSTHVVVPAFQVFALPEGFDFAQGASFPTVFLTAWYALHALVHPRPGQRLLVHSASGGVGGALLQLSRRAGCRAVGVVGASHKVSLAERLGAERVIDKSREDLWAAARRVAPWGFDVILDANGAATLRESYRHLRSPGKLVIYGFHTMLPKRRGRPQLWRLIAGWLRTPRFNPLDMTTANKSVMAFNLSTLFEERALLNEAMGDLLGAVEEGELEAPPVQRFPFESVADAHRALESGQTVGKLVLEL